MINFKFIKTGFFYLFITISILPFIACTSSTPVKTKVSTVKNELNEHLVLLHGLTNKHQWSEAFLEKCLSIWGSKNVFVVFTNNSEILYEKKINSKTIFFCGEDNWSAGDKSIEDQVELLQKKIVILQRERNLKRKFSIIAHSMGGLVSRRYIYKQPDVVKGVVTLGTPHHGSPIVDSFKWAGFFIGATEALNNLQPSFLKKFNERFPVKSSPLAENGKIYTIRGDCDGDDCFGWGGELLFGWSFLHQTVNKDSDGAVPFDSAIIKDAVHIGDFADYDHFELVKEPAVAQKASEYLLYKN